MDRPLLSGKVRGRVWGFLGDFLSCQHHWFLRHLVFFSPLKQVELGEVSFLLREDTY